jgi:hypothetical protein
MRGGLFSDRCAACKWEGGGTYSPTIEGMPRSSVGRIRVRWGDGDITPHALKVLRDASPAARGMSLAQLLEMMAGGRPFDLGLIAEHARILTSRQLEHAGFIVTNEAES